ncbi:Gfo/Idh/MocA family protein [Horticoccus sp. 23ND18S-11]|uniref:Gfo/Idh/MocA family protein n=1 Tax=Horticoccus sp. 23ND18S-11 TaxID=3391832 RepID=UPI0039C95B80
MKNWTRKEFIRASLLGGSAALVAGQTRLYGQVAPAAGSANGDIRVAVVGINAQGRGHMMDYCNKLPGARLVAICDVDSDVLAKRAADCEKVGVKPKTYGDYRKLLEDKDIDAVVLASPNHQHSLQTIWGLQAGKDVYCEKPLSHNVWEGRQAVEAAKKYSKNIVQAGTQNRSSEDAMEAISYIRSGKIGKIKWARALCYKQRDSIGRTTGAQPVPASINYDLWTGPADLTPPRRNGPKGTVHYDWHWFWNYGGGDITNQGIHQMDVARWLLGEPGLPPTVMSFGGRFGYQDDAETPNTLISVLGYEKAPLIFEVRGLPMKAGMRAMDKYRGTDVGVVVQCEGGYVTLGANGGALVYDNDKKKIEQFAKNTLGQHRANFVKAVKNRKVVNGLIEECHYSSALCHLANVSYLVGAEKTNTQLADAIKSNADTKDSHARMLDHLKANNVDPDGIKTVVGPLLKIDGKSESFVGSEKTIVDAANKSALLKREGRGAFKIPTFKNGAIAAS